MHPSSHVDPESYIQFKSMLVSSSNYSISNSCERNSKSNLFCFIFNYVGLHLLLAFFEILACDKLQTSRHIWVLVFLPMLFLSIVCIAVSIWALKHERPFEVFQFNLIIVHWKIKFLSIIFLKVELFLALNLLQLIFIPLKLVYVMLYLLFCLTNLKHQTFYKDGFITWRWDLVFIPIWIIYGAAVIGVSYSILLAALFSRSVNITNDQRRASTQAASSYVLLVIPSLISVVGLLFTFIYFWGTELYLFIMCFLLVDFAG